MEISSSISDVENHRLVILMGSKACRNSLRICIYVYRKLSRARSLELSVAYSTEVIYSFVGANI